MLWFRRDLRLADNPALHAAAGDGEVVALFVLDDHLLEKAAPARAAYLVESLLSLDASIGGRLLVVRGDPSQVVPEVAGRFGSAHVHVAADFSPYGGRRDARVAAALENAGRSLIRTGSPYAVAPGTVRTGQDQPYRVFTPFLRAWLEAGWPAPLPTTQVDWLPGGGPSAPAALRGVDTTGAAGRALFPAGEPRAAARWATFRDSALRDYGDARDRPDLPGTSRLSAALKFGELHPRTLLTDLSAALASPVEGPGAQTFRAELAWREFHADVLANAPSAASTSLTAVAPPDAWVSGEAERVRLAAWTAGRTGYPLVDAGMRQLLSEGWMHNRVRMIVASFLVKDLHVRWQRGAAHFMRHLVDGDVASNQLNWQWVAGTGRDAAPFFRVFNPVAQGLRHDPNGDYVRRHVPELAGVAGKAVHEPWRLPGGPPPGYPARIVDHATERRQALADHARRPRG